MESISCGRLLSRILLTTAAIGYGFVTNPLWTPHARFHVGWRILSHTGIAVISLSHLAERAVAWDCGTIEL
jgi:hypothetical protein